MTKDGKLNNAEIRLFVSQLQDRQGYRVQRKDRINTALLVLSCLAVLGLCIWFIYATLAGKL